jgi:hypothetical protein
MELKSSILIHRTPEQVWKFLGDPANVAKWDRGVADVEETSLQPRNLGYEFNTVAHGKFNLPDRGRMSYRIKETDPAAGRSVVELTSYSGNARFFRSAEWRFAHLLRRLLAALELSVSRTRSLSRPETDHDRPGVSETRRRIAERERCVERILSG